MQAVPSNSTSPGLIQGWIQSGVYQHGFTPLSDHTAGQQYGSFLSPQRRQKFPLSFPIHAQSHVPSSSLPVPLTANPPPLPDATAVLSVPGLMGAPVPLHLGYQGVGLSLGQRQQWADRFLLTDWSPWVFPTTLGTGTVRQRWPFYCHHWPRLRQTLTQLGWISFGTSLPRTVVTKATAGRRGGEVQGRAHASEQRGKGKYSLPALRT